MRNEGGGKAGEEGPEKAGTPHLARAPSAPPSSRKRSNDQQPPRRHLALRGRTVGRGPIYTVAPTTKHGKWKAKDRRPKLHLAEHRAQLRGGAQATAQEAPPAEPLVAPGYDVTSSC